VDINHIKETNDVRNSIIFDIAGNKLAIAQTEPPILKSRIKEAVVITYLAKENKEVVRYGFDATVVDLINNYELSTDNKTQAVILLKKTNPEQYNLRFFFRAETLSNSGIDISIYKKPVNILDISIGGAKISHNKELKLEHGRILDIKLSIDSIIYDISALVVRTWGHQEERMAKTLEFVGLEFINISTQLKNILGKKIFNIQRELRSREIL
jgi:hypothetical protein